MSSSESLTPIPEEIRRKSSEVENWLQKHRLPKASHFLRIRREYVFIKLQLKFMEAHDLSFSDVSTAFLNAARYVVQDLEACRKLHEIKKIREFENIAQLIARDYGVRYVEGNVEGFVATLFRWRRCKKENSSIPPFHLFIQGSLFKGIYEVQQDDGKWSSPHSN